MTNRAAGAPCEVVMQVTVLAMLLQHSKKYRLGFLLGMHT
jgi:hypothetical protein